MNLRLLALVGVLAGCAYDAEKFEEDYADAWCAYQLTCDPPFEPTDADCREELAEDEQGGEGCTFDKDAAKACINQLEGLQCQGAASNYPDVCEDVYQCS